MVRQIAYRDAMNRAYLSFSGGGFFALGCPLLPGWLSFFGHRRINGLGGSFLHIPEFYQRSYRVFGAIGGSGSLFESASSRGHGGVPG